MKFFTLLFLTFSALLGSTLSALEDDNIEEYLTYFWSGNEENLYLNINLSKELEFADNYFTLTTEDERGQGCEVICKPILKGTVFSSEGYELQKIKFTVMLNNLDNPNTVSSTMLTKIFYKELKEKRRRASTTSESQSETILYHPAIDLTQEPLFFTISEEGYEGVISFKNL